MATRKWVVYEQDGSRTESEIEVPQESINADSIHTKLRAALKELKAIKDGTSTRTGAQRERYMAAVLIGIVRAVENDFSEDDV